MSIFDPLIEKLKSQDFIFIYELDKNLGNMMDYLAEVETKDPELRQAYLDSCLRTMKEFYKLYQQSLKRDTFDIFKNHTFQHVDIEEVERILKDNGYLQKNNRQK